MSNTADDTGKPNADDAPGGRDDDTGNTPPEGTDDAPGGRDDDDDDGKSNPVSLEQARELRRENRRLRERTKAAEAALKDREEADLTESQKTARDLETERARSSQLETRVRELEVAVASAKLGVRPEAADVVSSLIDWTEVDASDPEDVTKAIKGVLKSKPFLATSTEGLDGGRGRGAGAKTGSSPSDIIRRAAGR